MKVLLDNSVGITNYLDSYYKVKITGTNYEKLVLCSHQEPLSLRRKNKCVQLSLHNWIKSS